MSKHSRITKADLEVGDVIRDKYGREAVVTRLESFDRRDAPNIGPATFGYVPASRDHIRADQVGGLCGVRVVEEIVGNRDLDER